RRWLAHAGLPLQAIEARRAALACWHDPPQQSASAASEAQTQAIVVNAAALPGPWFAAALDSRAPSVGGGGAGARPGRAPAAGLAPRRVGSRRGFRDGAVGPRPAGAAGGRRVH